MGRTIAIPRRLHGGAFRVADAKTLGLGRGRLTGADLATPFYGIRSFAAPTDIESRCRAYTPALRKNDVFSHLTAAALLGVPLPWAGGAGAAGEKLHVTSVSGPRARCRGIVGHTAHRTIGALLVGGVRVTNAVETFFALATVLPHVWLVVAGDALVGGRHPLCTLAQLTNALEQRTGERGAARARAALERVRLGVDSAMETLLRLAIVDAGLPEPTVNRRYWSPTGLYLGRADLSYPQWRITIEYEGDHHRTDPDQYAEDVRRRARFESAEWSVIQVEKTGLLRNPGEVIAVIRARIELQSRGVARGTVVPEPAQR